MKITIEPHTLDSQETPLRQDIIDIEAVSSIENLNMILPWLPIYGL